jgi:hydroxymethylpyrimidine/phosphomethylpyrimidine kinase
MAEKLPCALTLAGLDPGGGAGIAADLRAFAAAGAFGCAVTTLTTVQSTDGLRSMRPLPPALILEMAREVVKHQDVRAIKVGALGTSANARAIADFLKRHRDLPSVVDPVMIASRGSARLADSRAMATMRGDLLRTATLITPNVPEAEALTGLRIASLQDAHIAAARLCAMGAKAAMVKGGHLAGSRAVDVVAFENGDVEELSAERLPIRTRIHGGGCTLSSLIAGRLAVGDELLPAIVWSKKALQKALRKLVNVGGHLRVIVP